MIEIIPNAIASQTCASWLLIDFGRNSIGVKVVFFYVFETKARLNDPQTSTVPAYSLRPFHGDLGIHTMDEAA